jgi:hypothetical protein
MTAALVQKILAAFVILTATYSACIFAVHYDLTRKLSKSLFHLLPGIIFFGFGIAISIVFGSPTFFFKRIFPIKSGFAKGMVGGYILPYISASIRTMTIIASLTSLIDKMWYYWLNWRIYYIVRLISVVLITIIPVNVLFKLIFANDQATLTNATTKLNVVGAWTGSILGVLLTLLTILAIPKLFSKQNKEQA